MELPAAPLLGTRHLRSNDGLNSWIEVNPAVFARNLELVRDMVAGGAKCCAIMKADAYGAGIELLLPSLIKAGVGYVGVASNEEARAVRAGGYRGKLMRVRAASGQEVADALRHGVEELVGSVGAAQDVAAPARRHGRLAPIHIALNSGGMSRNGIDLATDAGRRELRGVLEVPALRVVGLMTHFPVEDTGLVLEGLACFKRDVEWILANTGLRREQLLLHAANSFVVQKVPEAHLDMVRPGGALYGYSGTPKPPFAHVVSFKTRVASLQAYPAGNTVSYDRTFTLERDSLLANLPVGYSDGYPRAYSNKGQVLVRGRRAPVVGRVTMNTMMVDVTDIPGVRPGDEVVLFGSQGNDELTQAELQAVSGIGLAEQYTAWGALNPKVVIAE